MVVTAREKGVEMKTTQVALLSPVLDIQVPAVQLSRQIQVYIRRDHEWIQAQV